MTQNSDISAQSPAAESAAKRVSELRERIRRANNEYYNQDNPTLTDAEYDTYFHELQMLEEQFPELQSSDSPTQRVGAETAPETKTWRHPRPMLSLANARSADELRAWLKRAAAILPQAHFQFVCELKIDGLAMALTYKRGNLTIAATRGDGAVGEDVTANALATHDVVRTLQGAAPDVVEIRGEIYMPISGFEQLNNTIAAQTAEKQNDSGAQTALRLFANPRNAAAGSLRQKDPEMTRSRNLHFFAYQIGYIEGGALPSTHAEALQALRNWGCIVNPNIVITDNFEDVIAFCEQWIQRRFELDYEIDGCVIKINDIAQQEELGVVARDPRWAIAFKFPPIQAAAKLLDIIISVGRTGSLNPQAVLEPVVIGGVTIKRASLYNAEDIIRKDLRPGDTVLIQRAGDVIPQIIKPILEKRPLKPDGSPLAEPFAMPEFCPSCGAKTVKDPDEAVTYCANTSLQCPAQRLELLRYFVSKDAMDIDGIGDEACAALLENGLVSTPSDLYALTAENLAALPGFKEKKIQNALKSIEKSKERPFAKSLLALGIRHVGAKAAELLAGAFGSIDALLAASSEEISAIPGIGPVIGASVCNWFTDPIQRDSIEKLRAAGVTLQTQQEDAPTGPLSGQTFLLTGKLTHCTRSQAENAIRKLGGSIAASVNKQLHHVIVGAEAGSKLEKAQKAKIPTHDETWLMELLIQNGIDIAAM